MASQSTDSRNDESVLPTPPPGYRRPRPLGQSMLVILLGSLVLTTGALVGSLTLFTALDASGDVGLIQAPIWLVILFGVGFTIVSHEGIHGLTYRYFGYGVEYGFTNGGFYTAAVGQIHTREESIWVAVAPVVVLTVVGILLLVVPSDSLRFVGLIVLVLNTSGSIADLEQLCRLLALPSGTLVCDADATYIYLPAD
jgi:hypothetical protein